MQGASTGLPRIPAAPRAIREGVALKHLLGAEACAGLARNLSIAYPRFDARGFRERAMEGLEPLELMQRGRHLAGALHAFLPGTYARAIDVLLASMTPPRVEAEAFGLEEFFYLPHSFFIAEYGLEPRFNGGRDPFEVSMRAQHALTTRFTAEFSIRPFLVRHPDRTLSRLRRWTRDPNPHVRRLCSEGTRPRLPWAKRIPALVADPAPVLPILDALRDDASLYVRRSVANHLGDIAKDHPELVFGICERWLAGAGDERRWLIRHALRHPAKQGNREALRLRAAAR